MKTALHQLEDDSAVLLMYLADELSADDQAEVRRRLAADAKLREALAQLEELQAFSDAALGRLDRAIALPDQAQALERVKRALASRAAASAKPAPLPKIKTARSMQWWVYSAGAAAACVLIAALVWMSAAQATRPRRMPAGDPLARMERSEFAPQDVASAAAEGQPFLFPTESPHDGGNDPLDDLERDLVALSSEKDSPWLMTAPSEAEPVKPDDF